MQTVQSPGRVKLGFPSVGRRYPVAAITDQDMPDLRKWMEAVELRDTLSREVHLERYKFVSTFLAGLLIGVACNGAMDSASAAAASDCTQWEFDKVEDSEPIPEGWEPFAWGIGATDTYVALRRCAD
jgi:hypothetical protein